MSFLEKSGEIPAEPFSGKTPPTAHTSDPAATIYKYMKFC